MSEPTRQALAVEGRSLPGKVTGKLRQAIEAMVWQALRRADAAKLVGLADESLRSALRKPHVMSYLNRELEVLRAGERPRNIHRLCEIRDHSPNMPAVNAIKTMLDMDAETATRSTSVVPGVTINIVHRASEPAAPVINVTPQRAQPLPASQPIEPDPDPVFRIR